MWIIQIKVIHHLGFFIGGCDITWAFRRDEAGVEYEEVFYHNTPITPEKLKDLINKLDIDASELVRTNEEVYKELNLSQKNLKLDELAELLCENPDLIQRPIVEKGNKVILARPPEKVKELLNE